ncbi:unnamed protein product [Protopolystoma xenopodis]|uniref:Uncharacterized protein n=1 Tax=Protopolystoma xenopodis TaxID=117903 RepID=A0A3S5AMT7_9PLAT|nr:unnamed protein product [Protopolystoma xenopodis]
MLMPLPLERLSTQPASLHASSQNCPASGRRGVKISIETVGNMLLILPTPSRRQGTSDASYRRSVEGTDVMSALFGNWNLSPTVASAVCPHMRRHASWTWSCNTEANQTYLPIGSTSGTGELRPDA